MCYAFVNIKYKRNIKIDTKHDSVLKHVQACDTNAYADKILLIRIHFLLVPHMALL